MMALRSPIRFRSPFSSGQPRSRRRSPARAKLRGFEALESRELLATFTVSNLGPKGAGSLRQAILQANRNRGADTINFGVAGTIRVGHATLPSITDPVAIDGSTAPTFAGSPVVAVDFHGVPGFQLDRGADGSTLGSLSVLGARNAGITLNASRVTLAGNYIGLRPDGRTVAGNRGDGVRINPTSHGDLIGQDNPVTGVSYYNANGVGLQPVSGWQGIRDSGTSGQYLITGTSNSNGLLYIGPISGVGGTSYAVNYPGAASTSVYGPDIVAGDVLRLVGSYRTGSGQVQGFLFQGTTADLTQAGNYRTIAYPGAQFTYVHSTMGDLAVGNADGPEGNLPIGTGHAFIYGVSQGQVLTDVVFPGSTSTTAYGVWQNGGTSYTICGGYTMLASPGKTIAEGYLVDFDAATGQFSHWTPIADPNGLVGPALATHFQGISSPRPGVYTLGANSIQAGSSNANQGSLVEVERGPDGSFAANHWVNLTYPGNPGPATADSVADNQVVGIVMASTGVFSYQATVNLGFQLSNVISGNGGNGIGIYGATDNRISMNFIGTDATGTLRRGNAQNGILLTNGAARNFIGGQVSNGNDPTGGVFVRPPQGNLISGNRANGVLINHGANQNLLSGNFIGTAASGNSALGNRLDGVAIDRANGNRLTGTTIGQKPFVYYNVISGNGGNGLRVTNSNDTVIHANFLGVGANNASIVANGGDGLLVSGTSNNTQDGGVIPLGNVISGNAQNGIEVRDRASGFVSFNTFAGIFAFSGAAPNRRDGILITSNGGNNLVRTSIVSGNLGNGIEISGQAQGVQVTDTAIGTNTSIQSAIPNQGSGILIAGNAHDNAIGGFQPSIEPQVTVSANNRYGIEIVGHAHHNAVFHTFVGTNFDAQTPLGNALDGIYLGPGTSANTIGGAAAPLQDRILDNGGNGLTIQSSDGNAVLGAEIASNARSGIAVLAGRHNTIGSANAGNTIASNGQDGLDLSGDLTGTTVQGNTINGNNGDGLNLNRAQRLTVGGGAPGAGNRVLANRGFGLFAAGLSTGTLVQGNRFAANLQGDVDISRARGITYIP